MTRRTMTKTIVTTNNDLSPNKNKKTPLTNCRNRNRNQRTRRQSSRSISYSPPVKIRFFVVHFLGGVVVRCYDRLRLCSTGHRSPTPAPFPRPSHRIFPPNPLPQTTRPRKKHGRYDRTKGLEFDPERGRRCTECFDMRMERAALYADEHGFHAIATTNATSRWKDAVQVDGSGRRAAERYDGLCYWAQDWKTDEMTLRKYQVRERERRGEGVWRQRPGVDPVPPPTFIGRDY